MKLMRNGDPELPSSRRSYKDKAPAAQDSRVQGWKSTTTYLLAVVFILAAVTLSTYIILKGGAQWGELILASTVLGLVCDRAISHIFGTGGRQHPLLSVLASLMLERARHHWVTEPHLMGQSEHVDQPPTKH
jgi:hypothetical protein